MSIKHQTKYSAGADLYANESVTIEAGQIKLVGTGYFLPKERIEHDNLVFMLCNRSSTAYKKGLIVANGVGVIDQDYCDEVKVMYINLSGEAQQVDKGDKVAQLVPMQYVTGVFEVEDKVRNGGFGSTG